MGLKIPPSSTKISQNVRQRFCRDYHIPINVKESPYFEYFLNLYDPLLKTKEKWLSLLDFIEEMGGEEGFFRRMVEVRNGIKDAIMAKKAYDDLINDSLEGFSDSLASFHPPIPKTKKTLYNPEDAGKYYICLDMRKANFASLQFYSTELVLNAKTYEEMISGFEDHPYVVHSRGLRQVLFGGMCPKKKQTIQRFLISRVYQAISDICPPHTVINASSDEVVLRAKEKALKEDLEKVNDSTLRYAIGWSL